MHKSFVENKQNGIAMKKHKAIIRKYKAIIVKSIGHISDMVISTNCVPYVWETRTLVPAGRLPVGSKRRKKNE